MDTAASGTRSGARRFVIASFVLGRAALLAVAALARAFVPEMTPNEHKDFVAFPEHPLWDSFCRWDSGWFHRIATSGYYLEGGQSDVAFFPAYPYLTRWLGRAMGGSWTAGLVLSNASLLAGLFFLHAVATRYEGLAGARRAVWMVLAYPATVFFSAYYAEGLFFFAVAACFFFYEEERLALAATFGALAALARLTGVLLFPALALGVLARGGWTPKALTGRALWLLLIPAALAVMPLLMAHAVGDPWAFLRASAGWGRSLTEPLVTLALSVRGLGSARTMDVLDLLATLGLLAVTFVALRTLDLAYAVFALLSVFVPLCSGRVHSVERYSASVLPVFLVLAHVTRRPTAARAVLLGMALLAVVQTALFVSWRWAG